MRHRCKVHHLAKPADQRKAVLRSLATQLFLHGEIFTTLGKAKALRQYAETILTRAKGQTVHDIRLVSRKIFNQKTGRLVLSKNNKEVPETVLQHVIRVLAPRYMERKGGCVRVLQAPPRQGDNAPMALVQLVEA
jgi:large subunit ribosomal protein L17